MHDVRAVAEQLDPEVRSRIDSLRLVLPLRCALVTLSAVDMFSVLTCFVCVSCLWTRITNRSHGIARCPCRGEPASRFVYGDTDVAVMGRCGSRTGIGIATGRSVRSLDSTPVLPSRLRLAHRTLLYVSECKRGPDRRRDKLTDKSYIVKNTDVRRSRSRDGLITVNALTVLSIECRS
jgi:hypothetical protein